MDYSTSRVISKPSFILPASGSNVSSMMMYVTSSSASHLHSVSCIHWTVDFLQESSILTKKGLKKKLGLALLGFVSKICKCKHNFPIMIAVILKVTSGIINGMLLIKQGYHDTSCISLLLVPQYCVRWWSVLIYQSSSFQHVTSTELFLLLLDTPILKNEGMKKKNLV